MSVKSRGRALLTGTAASLSVAIGVLLLGELGLRWAGAGTQTRFWVRGTVDGREVVRVNQEFASPFFPAYALRRPRPFTLDAEKPPGTFRVFVLGESAAEGDPEPAFSVARMLDVMLRRSFPGIRFEIVNAAITAINSHVVVTIAGDLSALEPDLFIVYMGNNEVIGPYGPGTVFNPFLEPRWGIRTSIAVRRTRLWQVMHGLILGEPEITGWGGMAAFMEHRVSADDPRLERTYAHYEANLRSIHSIARGAGAITFFCTVASNLADQPPFLGEGANLAFRRGHELLSRGDFSEARASFVRARDLDELRFRADSRINDIVRSLAGEGSDLHVIDAEQELAAGAQGGIFDNSFFLEHVHFTFDGTYAFARLLFDKVVRELTRRGLTDGRRPDEAPSRDEIAGALMYTPVDEIRILGETRNRIARPPFAGLPGMDARARALRKSEMKISNELATAGTIDRILEEYRAALRARPDDVYLLTNHAWLLEYQGRHAEAVEFYSRAYALYPEAQGLGYKLGRALVASGQVEEGRALLRAIAAARPSGQSGLYAMLARLALSSGDLDEALRWGEIAVKVDSQDVNARDTLHEIHRARESRN